MAQDDGPGKPWCYMDEPQCVRLSGVVFITMDYRLRFEHAQLLMNHYRYGRAHQADLERICHKSAVTIGDTNIETEIWGRIVLDELLLRMSSKLRLNKPSDIDLVRNRIPDICPHLNGLDRSISDSQTTVCGPCHAGRVPCVECSRRKSCQICSTRFQICGRELGNSGTEIHIDIWRYLGSCETPVDAKWRSQTDSSGPRISKRPDSQISNLIVELC